VNESLVIDSGKANFMMNLGIIKNGGTAHNRTVYAQTRFAGLMPPVGGSASAGSQQPERYAA
jgi:hypothetical protein